MFKKIAAIIFMTTTTASLAQEVSWPSPRGKAESLRYRASLERVDDSTSGGEIKRWYGVAYGGLSASIRDDEEVARIKLNATAAQLTGLDYTPLHKMQIELSYESPKNSYALLGAELPVVSPVTFYLAGNFREGGEQYFVGGPILYFAEHNLQVFFYSPEVKNSAVHGSVSARQNLRFSQFWLSLEASLRDTTDETYSPFGFGFGAGVHGAYVRLSYTPYADGLVTRKRSLEIGFDVAI